ncbi:MAG TPA: 2-hydroxyacid dehydrogenase [Microvirga sp.]|jgi:lactate dehydrogenase-like 2-hydroxyacid dehydrogenase|nr:2-hydroxyacid dehydrogenase [Microvirga sp.]
MPTTDVLMTAPMQPLVLEQLDAAFTLHRLWEAPDRDAFLAEVGPRIRGIATSTGHGRTDRALMSRLPALEIVSSFGVGYDNVDAAAAAERGVVVTNTPDVLNDEVADLTLGLLIATIRQIPQAERYLRAGGWLEKPYPLTATLRGRKVGIVGLGRIGKAIARRVEAFGVEVHYHGRNRQPEVAYPYHPSVGALAEACDVLIVITPGGAETRHLIDAAVLRALGPNGILINVARGSVVDEAALIEALRNGTILTAGLDVYADEPRVPQALIDMEHVVLLPHVASASVHTRNAMGQLVVDNLTAWFAGRGPLTPVAETPWPRR